MADPPQDIMEELLKIHGTKADIQRAAREKEEARPALSAGERIKRYPEPQRELDLHGKTSHEAADEIQKFIKASQFQRLRTVRIITGKGLHSVQGQSVLRELAEKRLSELRKQSIVIGYKWEKGKGALVVYLA